MEEFIMAETKAVPSGRLTDEERLKQLGYTQTLNRGWRKFTNISVTLSAMSVLISITSSFQTGLLYGGPVVCLWGWLLVGMLTLCQVLGMVGQALAEPGDRGVSGARICQAQEVPGGCAEDRVGVAPLLCRVMPLAWTAFPGGTRRTGLRWLAAEIASSMPTSGGVYFWIFTLIGPGFWGTFSCWVLGWLNLLGQIASLSAAHFEMATLISTMIMLNTGTAAGDGIVLTTGQLLGVYAGCLLLTACVNSCSFSVVSYLTEFGGIWHIIGAVLVIVVIPALTTEHQSAKYVFTKWQPEIVQDNLGIENVGYIFLLGLLFPAYSFTGYDGPSNISEESIDAGMAAPVAMLVGLSFMMVVGFAMNVSLLFSISDVYYVLGYAVDDYGNAITSEAGGAAVPQIFWDAFQARGGHGERGVGFLIIMLGGTFFCAVSTTTCVARIMYAYSRDRAIPGYQLWRQCSAFTQSPVYAVWGACCAAFLLGLIMLGSSQAFQGILSLATIALNLACVMPTFVRITVGRKRFVPGPFCLGWWAYPVGAIACIYTAVLTVMFSLPLQYPVASDNMNYAGPALLATLVVCLVWFWCPVYGAYNWFEGPIRSAEDAFSDGSMAAEWTAALALPSFSPTRAMTPLFSSRARLHPPDVMTRRPTKHTSVNLVTANSRMSG
ncbi:MAG: hypothetical protein WDW36_008127 [Sanguina aurantia]